MTELDSLLRKNVPKNGMFYTLAIDGRGGSGKTELAKYVHQLLPSFELLNGDDYFEPSHDGVAWGHFNEERFGRDVIEPLQKGKSFVYRPYDWHTEPHISKRPMVIQAGLILERCYSFMLDLDWDLKIWVETPKETCFDRGVARDHMPEKQEYKAWQVWQDAEDRYIAENHPESVADIVLNGTERFLDQLK